MSSGEFHDEVFDPDEIEMDEKEELSHLIDQWLAEARPERYEVGDKQWQDRVIEKVEAELSDQPLAEFIHEAARRRVYGREQQASRRANRLFKDIYLSGQLPIGWGEGEEWKALLDGVLRMPICIDKLRVRLGAASMSDFEEWILAYRDKQDKEMTSREQAMNGAAMVVQWMREHRPRRFEDLRIND